MWDYRVIPNTTSTYTKVKEEDRSSPSRQSQTAGTRNVSPRGQCSLVCFHSPYDLFSSFLVRLLCGGCLLNGTRTVVTSDPLWYTLSAFFLFGSLEIDLL